MASTITEVVIGSTLKVLALTIVDENDNPRNITGGAVRLQGTSLDLPSVKIDEAGLLTDPANGGASWPGIGDDTVYVSADDLGELLEATFSLRVKYTDAAGKVDFGPLFSLLWTLPPDVAP